MMRQTLSSSSSIVCLLGLKGALPGAAAFVRLCSPPASAPIRATQTNVDAVPHEATTVKGVEISRSGLSPDRRWITDPWDRGILFSVGVDQVVHDSRSAFQHVQVSIPKSCNEVLYHAVAMQIQHAS